jgi:hypothetical protein
LRITDHCRRVEKRLAPEAASIYVAGMNERIPPEKAADQTRQKQRQARLARQLRENLKRRKAQIRGRAAQSEKGDDERGN